MTATAKRTRTGHNPYGRRENRDGALIGPVVEAVGSSIVHERRDAINLSRSAVGLWAQVIGQLVAQGGIDNRGLLYERLCDSVDQLSIALSVQADRLRVGAPGVLEIWGTIHRADRRATVAGFSSAVEVRETLVRTYSLGVISRWDQVKR